MVTLKIVLKVLSSQASNVNVRLSAPPVFRGASKGVIFAFLAKINGPGLSSIPCLAGVISLSESVVGLVGRRVTGIFSASDLEIPLTSDPRDSCSEAAEIPVED